MLVLHTYYKVGEEPSDLPCSRIYVKARTALRVGKPMADKIHTAENDTCVADCRKGACRSYMH